MTDLMRRLGYFSLALFSGLLASGACSSDHDALKKKPPGSGGTGGGTDAGDSGPDVDFDVATDGPLEPVGETRLTLMHGVVDDLKIAFCFAKVTDGIVGEPIGSPLPSAGLTYGRSLAVESLDELDLEKDDFLTIVLAGDFASFAGKTCKDAIALAESYANVPEADAGADAEIDASSDAFVDSAVDGDAAETAPPPPPPPPVRARELAVLPAGTLVKGYSYLLVTTGCIGGPAFTDGNEKLACGETYEPTAPTLSPVLVMLSRLTETDRLGLQVVNADLAAGSIYLSSKPAGATSLPQISMAFNVGFGAISPVPPLVAYPKSAYGSPIGEATLELSEDGSAIGSLSTPWSSALALGELTDVEDGKNYAAILIGPQPTLPKSGFWNEARIAVVANDPTPQ